jgi:hypothetical protein
MTGGTPLPADFSPQSLPGTPDQAGGTGEQGRPDQPSPDPGGASNPSGAGDSGAGGPTGQRDPDDSRAPETGQPEDARESAGLDGSAGRDGPTGAEGTSAPGQDGAERRADDRPRPFFADQPDRPPPGVYPGRPYGQPLGPVPGNSWPAQNRDQNGYGQPGNQTAGWRPPAQPPQRPAAQRPTRPPERELRQRAIAALVFGAISLVALLGLGTDLRKGVYLLIFSAVVGIAACAIGITALRKARKTGSYRPRGAIGGIVLGALGTLITVPILLTYLAFPTQVNNYLNCLRQNPSGQQACMNKFYKSLHLGSVARFPASDVRVHITPAEGRTRR